MADLERQLVGTPYTLYTRNLMPSTLRLTLPGGEQTISIEMVEDDEVGVLIYEEGCGEPECLWSTKVES